jgi:hypothetical protein
MGTLTGTRRTEKRNARLLCFHASMVGRAVKVVDGQHRAALILVRDESEAARLSRLLVAA